MILYTRNISDLNCYLIVQFLASFVIRFNMGISLCDKKRDLSIKTNCIWENVNFANFHYFKGNYIYFCCFNFSIASMINGVFVVLDLLEYTRYMNLCDESSESYNCLFKFKTHIKIVIHFFCCIYLLNELYESMIQVKVIIVYLNSKPI